MQPDLQEGLKSRALERGRVPQEQIAGMGVMQPQCILRNSFASILEVFQREEARVAESENASSTNQTCFNRLKKPSDCDSATNNSLIKNGVFSKSESTPHFHVGLPAGLRIPIADTYPIAIPIPLSTYASMK